MVVLPSKKGAVNRAGFVGVSATDPFVASDRLIVLLVMA